MIGSSGYRAIGVSLIGGSNYRMISFEVNDLHLDGEVTSRWHALLRPVCDFTLRVEGTAIYSYVEFPVVEFAVAVGNWAVNAEADGPEFAYTSLESETERLSSFTPHQDGDWIASSLTA